MEVSLTELSPAIEDMVLLKKKWTQLEVLSDNVSFFTSWSWIGCWLSTLDKEAWLLEIKYVNQTIAIGIFIERQKGFWPFRKKQLWLNKAGEQKLDQIWIEYNDLVIHRDFQHVITADIWQKVLSLNKGRYQEIHVDVSKHKVPPQAITNEKQETMGFIKKLYVNGTKKDLLSDVSKNTRNQINRSKRLLEQKGKLSLIVSDDLKSKQDILALVAINHRKQWGNTQWGSGFDNPLFYNFHKNVIKTSQTTLLRLSIDDHDIAFGYYFCFKSRVYFYLSAIEHDKDNRVKIGFVFHLLAMEYFQSLGFDEYDFLGGEARYKASLSDITYPLYSWTIYQQNWLTKIEVMLRKFKRLVKREK